MSICSRFCVCKDGVQIHEWEWNDEKEEWEESYSVDWDHCIDPEYLNFLALYGQLTI